MRGNRHPRQSRGVECEPGGARDHRPASAAPRREYTAGSSVGRPREGRRRIQLVQPRRPGRWPDGARALHAARRHEDARTCRHRPRRPPRGRHRPQQHRRQAACAHADRGRRHGHGLQFEDARSGYAHAGSGRAHRRRGPRAPGHRGNGEAGRCRDRRGYQPRPGWKAGGQRRLRAGARNRECGESRSRRGRTHDGRHAGCQHRARGRAHAATLNSAFRSRSGRGSRGSDSRGSRNTRRGR